ncbi:hypothetical protein L1887_57570 [Cichorium endivia]|nr:hypothetical protein L1887_57570 [Cichorium endivia]
MESWSTPTVAMRTSWQSRNPAFFDPYPSCSARQNTAAARLKSNFDCVEAQGRSNPPAAKTNTPLCLVFLHDPCLELHALRRRDLGRAFSSQSAGAFALTL